MYGTNRRNTDSVANAVWGSASEAVTPIRRYPHCDSIEVEGKIQPKWVQDRDRDAANSLLMLGVNQTSQGNEHDLEESTQQRLRAWALQQNEFDREESGKDERLRVLAHQQLEGKEKQLEEQEHHHHQQQPPVNYSVLDLRGHPRNKRPRVWPFAVRSKEIEKKWNERIQEVKQFVKEHGHGRIPVSYPKNHDLASWSKRQRYHYKVFVKNMRMASLGKPFKAERCHMTQERLQALTDAGFCFDLHVAKWDRNYQLLKRCKLYPSKRANYELRKWIETQRHQMSLLRRGEKSLLNPERIQKLNDIGFSWTDEYALKSKINAVTAIGKISLAPQQQQIQMSFSVGAVQNGRSPAIGNCQHVQNLTHSIDSVPLEAFVVRPNQEPDGNSHIQ